MKSDRNITCVFLSNYLNHHQIPFCNAMYRFLGGRFVFLQTEAVEEERVRMGWNEKPSEPYLRLFYEEAEACRRLVLDAGLVIFGGTDDEGYIEERLAQGKPVVRYSERLYKTGQWKAVSPRGLRKKYHDHTRHHRQPVYLLCAGAYVPSDFHIVRAYPGKMFCWGYFPETKHYDVEALLEGKGRAPGQEDGRPVPYLLWAARMIDLKHPELAVETAAYLRERGLAFHMDLIGGGALQERVEAMIRAKGLESCVELKGFLRPEQVREHMERADVFLFTSDRQEGWGAVANEAMNSGCALVADHMIGAVPYLVRHGENGYVYRDGHKEELFALTERLVRDRELCRRLGRNAYHTVADAWNAEYAAEALLKLCLRLGLLRREDVVWPMDGQNADDEGTEGLGADGLDMDVQFGAGAGVRRVDDRSADGLDVNGRSAGGSGVDDRSTDGQSRWQGFVPCAPAPVIPERKMYRFLTARKDGGGSSGR